MLSMKFVPVLFTLSYYLNVCYSGTCCVEHLLEPICTTSASNNGQNCVWYESSDELFIDGIHCRSASFKGCSAYADATTCSPVAACEWVPAIGACRGEGWAECYADPGCDPSLLDGDSPDCASGSDSYGESSSPGSVADEIDGDFDDTCSSNTYNCWTNDNSAVDDIDYSTNSYAYTGVEYKSGACCYNYYSEKTTNLNCRGNNPDQSHIVLQIDCLESEFTLTSDNAEYISYGLDQSTCYTGIKLDTGCGNTAAEGGCNYEVCIEYAASAVTAGECYVQEGWIMNKAANVFAFNALEGIPTCTSTALSRHSRNSRADEEEEMILDVVGTNKKLDASRIYVGLTGLVFIIGAIIYFYRRSSYGKIDEFKGLNQSKDGYSTFNQI